MTRVREEEPQWDRIGDLLVEAIEDWPDRIAFVDAAGALTYRELGKRIGMAIGALDALGVRPGETVVQLSGNRIGMFCVMAAAYIGGFKSVTLHYSSGADEHAHILGDCNATVFIGESCHAERQAWLRRRCPRVRHWFAHDAAGEFDDFWELAARHEHAASLLETRGHAEQIIRLAYTGGTTGKPKGVMLSNRAMAFNARLWLSRLEWRNGLRCLCSAPISHGAGSLIYPTLARGGTVYLQRGFTVGAWLEIVERERIETTFVVPTMLYALLEDARTRRADLSSLNQLIYGAAPMAPARIRQALDVFGNVLVQMYGQSEAPNTVLVLDQADHATADDGRLAAAGKPFPGLEVVLFDQQGGPVQAGEVGEICVRGPLLMSGYHHAKAATSEAMRNGWLRTGDLARQDDEGYFYIVDRTKDMIISGGFNVYPKEVEDVLATHPDVLSCAVIGVPDEKWGEAVKAVVVPRRKDVHAQTLIDYVRSRKGPIHAPKSVDFTDALPLTGLGKPDKKALRKKYWDRQDRDVA